jgi:signal transduction histidine kinase
MDIKIVTAQIFSIFLIAVFISEVFLSKTLNDFLIRLIGLFLVAALSYFLVKSVAAEVHRREEIQKLAFELGKANKELSTLNRAKTEFISIASHQLRTPLSIVKGYLSMILDGDYGLVKKNLAEILKKVYGSNERLIGLVNDLLNISRIESGRLEYHLEPVELEKIAEELIEGFKMKAEAKKLELHFEYPKIFPKVNADSQKIKEVISNLLDNAIKYTDKGWIAVELESKDKQIICSVADTGLGVAPNEQKKIFEKFTHGQSSSGVTGGLGIGLFICKKFIEGHNGKIWVESEGLGKGSKFSFSLPIK